MKIKNIVEELLIEQNLLKNKFLKINNTIIPKDLWIKAKNHKHSLGTHPSFPPDDEYTFEQKLLQNIFIKNGIKLNDINNLEQTINNIENKLSILLNKAKKIEKPIRKELEKICIEHMIELFNISSDDLDFSVELVDTIRESDIKSPNNPQTYEFEFDDIDDSETLSNEVYKRRLVNCLNIGGAINLLNDFNLSVLKLYKLNPDLLSLYYKIFKLNNVLIYLSNNKENVIGSTHNIVINNKIDIEVKAINFVSLMVESIYSILNALSLLTLNFPKEKKQYIINKADFNNAKLWDMRLGIGLWDLIFNDINQDITPHIYKKILNLPTSIFFKNMKEIFGKTKQGKIILNNLFNESNNILNKKELEEIINNKRANYKISDNYYDVNGV